LRARPSGVVYWDADEEDPAEIGDYDQHERQNGHDDGKFNCALALTGRPPSAIFRLFCSESHLYW